MEDLQALAIRAGFASASGREGRMGARELADLVASARPLYYLMYSCEQGCAFGETVLIEPAHERLYRVSGAELEAAAIGVLLGGSPLRLGEPLLVGEEVAAYLVLAIASKDL